MSAWKLLSLEEYMVVWDAFESQFDFRPTIHPNQFPSIKEPDNSVTYQFEYPSAEEEETALYDLNAKSLIAFQSLVSPNEAIYALDWQHDCYSFFPHVSFERWQISVFPNGDYSIFLAGDFRFGIFAHPWEQTFCIWGNELSAKLINNKPLLFERVIRKN